MSGSFQSENRKEGELSPSDIGYIDLDHVVLTVENLDKAVSEFADYGIVAAPSQLEGNSDTPVAGVRHLVFKAPANDIANMIVLSQPGPPTPVLVAASKDLEETRQVLGSLGLANGDVVKVPDRSWIDPSDKTRHPILASRLAMANTVPMAVNATHAAALATYHLPGFQTHRHGVQRMVGVDIKACDVTGVAKWLGLVLHGKAAKGDGEGWSVFTRDCFIRVYPSDDETTGVTGILFEVSDLDSHLSALPPQTREQADSSGQLGITFPPTEQVSVTLTFIGTSTLADLLKQ
ncbi:hypothetical protein [uncultured Cohaesibacter sp.]|uniref:hypothetical protein n=1 Tax=uncultured Cohaesibacter sp. TaxID=1002546 RepID=UPI00292FB86D|nr:hypothetical protein [uncultured Cohaesibacter sp.]